MRKQGSLREIILLVISFSVINYVVSKSVRLRQADTLFFITMSYLIQPPKSVSLSVAVQHFYALSGLTGVETIKIHYL